jgi:acetyltransferase-like isoleucine patch superfamily enzyme
MAPSSARPCYRQVVRWLLLLLYRPLHWFLERGAALDRDRRARRSARLHASVRVLEDTRIDNFAGDPEFIEVGEGTVLRGELTVFAHGGRIRLGRDCYLGHGSRVWSMSSVTIGDRVLISHGVNIHDANSHPIDAAARHRHAQTIFASGHPREDMGIEALPVVIEDDAWIGFNATVLKGVTVGRGAIVAACSVVTTSVPPACVVVGNPARVVKQLSP